jgi:rhamnosyltransferase
MEECTSLDNAAIIAPLIHDRGADNYEGSADGGKKGIIDWCITSGSYNNVNSWNTVGGFQEDFFIDYVDLEYSARVRHYGYNIYRAEKNVLNHEVGRINDYNIMGHKIFVLNHSALRKYYITRNTIVSHKLFPREEFLSHPYLRTIKRSILVVLFEKDKYKKIVAIIKGIRDSKALFVDIVNENNKYYFNSEHNLRC